MRLRCTAPGYPGLTQTLVICRGARGLVWMKSMPVSRIGKAMRLSGGYAITGYSFTGDDNPSAGGRWRFSVIRLTHESGT